MNDEIIYIENCNSTNDYLKKEAKSKLIEGTVVCTDFQTAGKGQRGNSWESEEGKNLLFSMVLYPNIKASEQFIISQFVSVAIKEVLDRYTDNITIKWPNDIYWQDKKISGMLIENRLMENNIEQSVVGIGLNINQTKFRSDAPNPVSLKMIKDREFDREAILKLIRTHILINYLEIKEGNMAAIIQKYKQSLFRGEGYHLYNDGIADFSARIVDVEPSGIFVLETNEGIERRFAFKEVRYVL